MKTVNFRAALVLLIAILFNQCTEREILSPETFHDITVQEVKTHYAKTLQSLRKKVKDLGIDWDKGIYKDLGSGEMLYFPLTNIEDMYVRGSKKAPKLYVGNTSYAVAYKVDNKVELYLVQPVPTAQSESFTGFVTVTPWSKKQPSWVLLYKNGFKVKGLKAVGKLKATKGQKSWKSCTEGEPNWWCTDVYVGGELVYRKCTNEGTTYICDENPSFFPDDISGRGGSGPENGQCEYPFFPGLYADCAVVEADLWERGITESADFLANPCLSGVWQKLQTTNAAHDVIQAFIGDNPSPSLHLDVGRRQSANAITFANTSTKKIHIEFNLNRMDRSALSHARTFLHELIHAELYRLMDFNGYIDTDNHPALMNSYMVNERNWQHEYMANFYTNIIGSGLAQFDSYRKPTQFYKDIAWIGLFETYDKNNKNPDGSYNVVETQAYLDLSADDQIRIFNNIIAFQRNENSDCE